MGMVKFNSGMVVTKASGATPTPEPLGLVTDISVNIKQAKVLVRGQKRWAVDAFDAEADGKVSCKFQSWGSRTYAAAISGGTTTTGSKVGILDEAVTVPGTPYQITVANGANMFEDLGVRDVNTGLALVRVVSGPTTGQYSVNETTGVYTFAAADTTHAMRISYSYTAAAIGKTVAIANSLMGQSAQLALSAWNNYGTGKNYGMKFFAVVFDGLDIGWKVGAVGDANMTGQIIAASNDAVADWYEMD